MSDDGDLLPVQEWQMKRPSVLAALNNQYERDQVGLCGLFSTTVKDAGVSQWHHIQGRGENIMLPKSENYAMHANYAPQISHYAPEIYHYAYKQNNFFRSQKHIFP